MNFVSHGTDTAFVRISFKDGDADIEQGKVKLVYQHDSSGNWVGNVSFDWTVKDFPAGTNANATSGEIIVQPPPPINPFSPAKFHYIITFTDRAGHVSNTITTPDLTL